ncbi:unnamed protein product, partial [Closterium sp. NIES-54]
GVQPLLDGVVDYLPCPTDVANHALDQSKAEEKVCDFETVLCGVVDCLPCHAMPCPTDVANHGVDKSKAEEKVCVMQCPPEQGEWCTCLPCSAHPLLDGVVDRLPCHAMPCHAMPCHAMPCPTDVANHALPWTRARQSRRCVSVGESMLYRSMEWWTP